MSTTPTPCNQELLTAVRQAALVLIRDTISRRGFVTAEVSDDEGFHEITLLPDGTGLFARYLGDRVPVDLDLNSLPWNTLSSLVNSCSEAV